MPVSSGCTSKFVTLPSSTLFKRESGSMKSITHIKTFKVFNEVCKRSQFYLKCDFINNNC